MTEKEFNRFEKRVYFGERSVRFLRTSSYNPALHREKIEKRGNIDGFSRHSALRLRDALSQYHLTHSRAVGVTLTVPWQVESYVLPVPSCIRSAARFDEIVDYDRIFADYKAAFNRFGVAFRRRFPNSAAIFRHELQKRKIPHCHLVIYFSDIDLPYRSLNVKDDDVALWIREKMYEIWQSAIKFDFKGGDVEGFYRKGICVQFLDDLPAMFRYIGDHTSKSKQAQLGYKGKQWGFLNRSVLVCRHFSRFDFADSRELVLFSRTVRKLSRFVVSTRSSRKDEKGRPLPLDCSFGCKLSNRRQMRAVFFVDFNTSRRIFDWIIQQRNQKGDHFDRRL